MATLIGEHQTFTHSFGALKLIETRALSATTLEAFTGLALDTQYYMATAFNSVYLYASSAVNGSLSLYQITS